MARFTKESLKVTDLDEKVAMVALQQGTTNEGFKMSLAKNEPANMHDLQERADKYIKAEESMRKSVITFNDNQNSKKRKADKEYYVKDRNSKDEKTSDSTSKKPIGPHSFG